MNQQFSHAEKLYSDAPKGGVAPCSRRVMNLSHVLLQAARRYPEETGFVWGEHTWTWAALNARVDAMVAALRKHGVSKGDRILVQCKNGNQMFETMFVCFRLGAVWVPTNYRQTPEEVAYLAESSGASLMFCHADFKAHAEAAEKSAFSITRTIFIGGDGADSYDRIVDLFMGSLRRQHPSTMMIPAGFSIPPEQPGGQKLRC